MRDPLKGNKITIRTRDLNSFADAIKIVLAKIAKSNNHAFEQT
jgi:hypothetical protein